MIVFPSHKLIIIIIILIIIIIILIIINLKPKYFSATASSSSSSSYIPSATYFLSLTSLRLNLVTVKTNGGGKGVKKTNECFPSCIFVQLNTISAASESNVHFKGVQET